MKFKVWTSRPVHVVWTRKRGWRPVEIAYLKRLTQQVGYPPESPLEFARANLSFLHNLLFQKYSMISRQEPNVNRKITSDCGVSMIEFRLEPSWVTRHPERFAIRSANSGPPYNGLWHSCPELRDSNKETPSKRNSIFKPESCGFPHFLVENASIQIDPRLSGQIYLKFTVGCV